MSNLASIWQKIQSRNQDDIGAQRRYWLDLLKGRTNLGPPAPGASPAKAGAGSNLGGFTEQQRKDFYSSPDFNPANMNSALQSTGISGAAGLADYNSIMGTNYTPTQGASWLTGMDTDQMAQWMNNNPSQIGNQASYYGLDANDTSRIYNSRYGTNVTPGQAQGIMSGGAIPRPQPPAYSGSGPYQPIGKGIPTVTGSGPYQPQGSSGIPSYSGSGPYQPLNLPKPNIPLYSGSGPYQPMGAGQQRSNILDVLRNSKFGQR